MVVMAHKALCTVVLIDVQALDIDFYVFSAHKLYGPTGLGICIDLKQVRQILPECWRLTLL